MKRKVWSFARVGLTLQVGAVIVAIDAAAAHGIHRSHIGRHHQPHDWVQSVSNAASPSPIPVRMRYYGGPKSPMWPAQ